VRSSRHGRREHRTALLLAVYGVGASRVASLVVRQVVKELQRQAQDPFYRATRQIARFETHYDVFLTPDFAQTPRK